jgi:leader peptidase (prepilin peptidase)/N-methyltransferase
LLGLAFGSFLNVCLSRWPEGESLVEPRSHCRRCSHALMWWENVPLASWMALRGRCRSCGSWIGWRYVMVEAAVGTLWAAVAWRELGPLSDMLDASSDMLPFAHPLLSFVTTCGWMAFYWVLVALAVLDAEHLWLPDWLTLPGIAAGFLMTNFQSDVNAVGPRIGFGSFGTLLMTILEIAAAGALVVLIRWVYWLIRRREGIGFGDAKLMALLAAWLGLPGALLAFAIAVLLGAVVALLVLVASNQRTTEPWGLLKLPLGTFLCIGGIMSGLWGQRIISAYMGWAGF